MNTPGSMYLKLKISELQTKYFQVSMLPKYWLNGMVVTNGPTTKTVKKVQPISPGHSRQKRIITNEICVFEFEKLEVMNNPLKKKKIQSLKDPVSIIL